MPKLKQKRCVAKRFKITASGKVMGAQSNKQHNMRKRSKRQLRVQRGTEALNPVEARRVKRFLPYSL